MILEHLVHGVIIGSLIAFTALGYSLIYSILRFINFAHGEFLMLGAYLCYLFYRILGIKSFFLSALLALVCTGLAGVIIEKIAYKPLRERGRLAMLITSFGVSIVLQAIISLFFGSSTLVYGVNDPLVKLGGMSFYIRELVIICLLLLNFFIISIALKRSMLGLSIRAISTNPTKVLLSGMPVDRMISIVFFITAFLAAIAGISLGIETGLTPSNTFQYSIWAFAAAVIAGLGSIRGIIIAGLLLGVFISFALTYGSALLANAIALGAMVLILLVRPQGIFVQKSRSF